MKQKVIESQGSEVNFVRENDILSACLGPEHTDRVRGFSSYKGWKHGFSDCREMYKKRRRAVVDYVALKAELRDEIMGKVMKKMGVLQGVQTEAGSIPTVVG